MVALTVLAALESSPSALSAIGSVVLSAIVFVVSPPDNLLAGMYVD